MEYLTVLSESLTVLLDCLTVLLECIDLSDKLVTSLRSIFGGALSWGGPSSTPFRRQCMVCHACHTCTDIMHASYYR